MTAAEEGDTWHGHYIERWDGFHEHTVRVEICDQCTAVVLDVEVHRAAVHA